jgi:hypothetical protein
MSYISPTGPEIWVIEAEMKGKVYIVHVHADNCETANIIGRKKIIEKIVKLDLLCDVRDEFADTIMSELNVLSNPPEPSDDEIIFWFKYTDIIKCSKVELSSPIEKKLFLVKIIIDPIGDYAQDLWETNIIFVHVLADDYETANIIGRQMLLKKDIDYDTMEKYGWTDIIINELEHNGIGLNNDIANFNNWFEITKSVVCLPVNIGVVSCTYEEGLTWEEFYSENCDYY